jgi:hypothetical protein
MNRVYRDSFERAVVMGDIDEVIEHMYQQGELGADAAREHLVEPFSLAKVSTACVGLLACLCTEKRRRSSCLVPTG